MEPVAAGIRPPNTLERLSQILGIQSQQQALEGQEAEVAGMQQTQRQRAALAEYDYMQHLGEDGTIDLNSLAADPQLRAAAGDLYPSVLGSAAQVKTQQLQAKSSLLGLRTEQRKAFAELVGSLRGDKDVADDTDDGRRKLNEAMVQYAEIYGEDTLPVLKTYADALRGLPKGKLSDALKIVQMQALDAGGQVAAQQPVYQGTGGAFSQINPNALPTSAPSMPATIPPGFDVVTDPRTGNPYLLNQQTGETRDFGKGYPGARPTGVVSPAAAPSSSIPEPMKPGELEITRGQAEALSERTSKAQEMATSSPQALDALQRARTILDTDISTGVPFEVFTKMKNAFAGFGFDVGTDANSLVKNLARYQAARATAAGLGGTDAARELAEKGSPNTKIDAKALQGVVTQSLATEMALQGYANSITGISDPKELARRENEFRTTPNLIQSYEYGLSRTPKEAEEFLKKSGISRDEMKKSRDRLRALGAL